MEYTKKPIKILITGAKSKDQLLTCKGFIEDFIENKMN